MLRPRSSSPKRKGRFTGRPAFWLFRLEEVPKRLLGVLGGTPGLTLFAPVAENVALAVGYRHPVHLGSCKQVFPTDRLFLFSPGPAGVTVINPAPTFSPVADLVRLEPLEQVAPEDTRPAIARPTGRLELVVPLRLEPGPTGAGRAVATIVPWPRLGWLRSLCYALPPSALRGYRLAALERGLLVVAPDALAGFPFGQLLYAPAAGLLVPLGWELRPAVSPDELAIRVGATGGAIVVFPGPGEAPFRIPPDSIESLEARALSDPRLADVRVESAIRPVRVEEPIEVEIENQSVGTDAPVAPGRRQLKGTSLSRQFISRFLLPLVRGGTLEVGRPLSRRGIEALARDHALRPTHGERDAAVALGVARRQAVAALVPQTALFDIDDDTWRLGAAVHDLLALAHPRIASGPGSEARIGRIAAVATALGSLGAPRTLRQTLARHSLVARLPEVMRLDRTVRYWLGRQTFVGRRPPARVLALPRVRGVKVETVRRAWLRDVGVPAAARPAFLALTEGSPLGEALDPLRLDPPPSWGRVLPALRYPVICRLVAGRMVEIGVGRAGDALAQALYRFASLRDSTGPVAPSAEAVAFALGFLAHITWLDHLFDRQLFDQLSRATWSSTTSSTPRTSTGSGGASETVGRDLAVVLAAAAEVEPRLIWPSDVTRASDLGQGFASLLGRMFDRHDVKRSSHWSAALDLARLAAVGARGPAAVNAV